MARFGWVVESQRGSHRKLVHPDRTEFHLTDNPTVRLATVVVPQAAEVVDSGPRPSRGAGGQPAIGHPFGGFRAAARQGVRPGTR